jgi:nickel/cobalt exporter
MYNQLAAAIFISVLHGMIPSHWLPVIALGKKYNWSDARILKITLQCALAHAMSTIAIGLLVAVAGEYIGEKFGFIWTWLPAALLIGLGSLFIYRHYTHHHFHVHEVKGGAKNIVWPVVAAMFVSPCLEIEGYFFTLSRDGWNWVWILSAVYLLTTIGSMFFWVWVILKGLNKVDAHKWTHNAGIITGLILVLSGLLFLLD